MKRNAQSGRQARVSRARRRAERRRPLRSPPTSLAACRASAEERARIRPPLQSRQASGRSKRSSAWAPARRPLPRHGGAKAAVAQRLRRGDAHHVPGSLPCALHRGRVPTLKQHVAHVFGREKLAPSLRVALIPGHQMAAAERGRLCDHAPHRFRLPNISDRKATGQGLSRRRAGNHAEGGTGRPALANEAERKIEIGLRAFGHGLAARPPRAERGGEGKRCPPPHGPTPPRPPPPPRRSAAPRPPRSAPASGGVLGSA